ncbi:hypothetical protein [Pontiella sp.]|uniref:hypothetical protein n=1 Tax=Pontiella sp. TaxID=2837462 RepID=UPI0035664005
MKTLIAPLYLMAAATAFGFQELRQFTLEDGSAFNAAVIDCDSHVGKVDLLAEGGATVTAGIAVFSENDRDYLKQWEMCDRFMSPTQFVVIARFTADRVLHGEAGKGENGDALNMVCDACAYRYNVTIHNLSDVDLENVTLNYHILYKQKCSASESLSFAQQYPSPAAAEGEVTVSYAVDGSIPVPRLEANGWKMYATEPVVLTDANADFSSSLIVITASMETPDGDKLTRLIELP